MSIYPTKEENPDGLHQRYKVEKIDGTPIDPKAVYFVLRIDRNGDDPIWTSGCRQALRYLVGFLASKAHLSYLQEDLVQLIETLEHGPK